VLFFEYSEKERVGNSPLNDVNTTSTHRYSNVVLTSYDGCDKYTAKIKIK